MAPRRCVLHGTGALVYAIAPRDFEELTRPPANPRIQSRYFHHFSSPFFMIHAIINPDYNAGVSPFFFTNVFHREPRPVDSAALYSKKKKEKNL